VTQRQRWSAGTAQTFRALPWSILRQLRLPQAFFFSALTLFYGTVSAVLMAALAILAVSWLIGSPHAPLQAMAVLVAVAAIVVPKSFGAALAARTLNRPVGIAFFRDLITMWLMQAALLPSGSMALVKGYFSRRLPFLRTPKKGR